jgi:hypothetical protein
LEEWRFWCAEDLGANFVAVLDDTRLGQLPREFAEANPILARKYPWLIPHRMPGLNLHFLQVHPYKVQEDNSFGNGASVRRFYRYPLPGGVTCGLYQGLGRPFSVLSDQEQPRDPARSDRAPDPVTQTPPLIGKKRT